MHFPTLALVAPLFGAVIAIPTTSSHPYTLKERHPVPAGWSAVSRAPAAHPVKLQIGLRHRNQDVLEKHVIEVSNPTHERYGQYLSADEISDLIAPSDSTIDLVYAWLREHGVDTATLTPTRDWLTVVLPVEKVEALLDTTYSVFRHNDGSTIVRAPEWSLPHHLHEHIDVVQPTTSFFRTSKQSKGVVPQDGPITWHGGHGVPWPNNAPWGNGPPGANGYPHPVGVP